MKLNKNLINHLFQLFLKMIKMQQLKRYLSEKKVQRLQAALIVTAVHHQIKLTREIMQSQ